MELGAGFAVCGTQVCNYVFRGPASAGHDYCTRLEMVQLALLRVADEYKVGVGGITFVLHIHDRGAQADAGLLARPIVRGKVDSALADAGQSGWTRNRFGNECFYGVARDAIVTAGEGVAVRSESAVHDASTPAISRYNIGTRGERIAGARGKYSADGFTANP